MTTTTNPLRLAAARAIIAALPDDMPARLDLADTSDNAFCDSLADLHDDSATITDCDPFADLDDFTALSLDNLLDYTDATHLLIAYRTRF